MAGKKLAYGVWKAIDHARDEDGKFATKGSGTFVTGGANKATPGTYAGKAGKGINGQYHVGGATAKDPKGNDTGYDVDWSLAPGAKVHPVTGGTKEQVLVHHPDNTKTLMSATPAGQEPKIEKVFGAHEDAAGQLKKNGERVGKPIDAHPDAAGTTYETAIAHKVGGVAQLNAMGTGAKVTIKGEGQVKYTYQKQTDGTWVRIGKDDLAPAAQPLDAAAIVARAKDLGGEIQQDPHDAGDADPDQVASSPPGAKVKLHGGNSAVSTLTKGQDDSWVSDATGNAYPTPAVAAYAAGHNGGKVENLGPPEPTVVPPQNPVGSKAHLVALPTGAKIAVQKPTQQKPGATFTKQPNGEWVNDQSGAPTKSSLLEGLYGPGDGYDSQIIELDALPGSDPEPEPVDEKPAPEAVPDFAAIPDAAIDEPPLPTGKKISTGMVIREPDGRVWIFEPKGHFAGYEHSWPKGTMDKGTTLTGQQNAHKEVHEETGLTAKIVGFLGDYSGSTMGSGSVTRMYLAERVGGTPHADDPTPFVEGGAEAAAVKLVTPEEAVGLLNKKRDKDILGDALAKVPAPTPPSDPTPQEDGTPAVPGVDGGPPEIFESALHHPSGATIALKPGDQVYRHKKVTTSYLIGHADGGWEKVDKNGKVVKPQGFLVDKLDAKYDQVHVEPEATDYKVPGTNVTLQPGEELWGSNGNTQKWAVALNGKITKLIDKDSGEVKTGGLHNWQKSYAKGGVLLPAGKHPGLPEDQQQPDPVDQALEDKAAEIAAPDLTPEPDAPPTPATTAAAWTPPSVSQNAPARPDSAVSFDDGTLVGGWAAAAAYGAQVTLPWEGAPDVWTKVDANEWVSSATPHDPAVGDADVEDAIKATLAKGEPVSKTDEADEADEADALDPALTAKLDEVASADPGTEVTLGDFGAGGTDTYALGSNGWVNVDDPTTDPYSAQEFAGMVTEAGADAVTVTSPMSQGQTQGLNAQWADTAEPGATVKLVDVDLGPGEQDVVWTKQPDGSWSNGTISGATTAELVAQMADVSDYGLEVETADAPEGGAPAADAGPTPGWKDAPVGSSVKVTAGFGDTAGQSVWTKTGPDEYTNQSGKIKFTAKQMQTPLNSGDWSSVETVPGSSPQAPAGSLSPIHPTVDELKAMPVGTVLQHVSDDGTDYGSWQKITDSYNGLAGLDGWSAIDEKGKQVGGTVPAEDIAANAGPGTESAYLNKGVPAGAAPPTPPKKPKAKAVKVDLSGLTDTYETPTGQQISLAPGEALVGVGDSDDAPTGATYLHIPNGGTGAKFLDGYGEELPKALQPKGKHSVKSWAAKGGTPLAVGPAKQDAAVPVAQPSEQWDAQKLLEAADTSGASSVGNMIVAAVKAAEIPTKEIGPQGILSHPEFAATIAQVKANLDAAAAQWKSALSTQEKNKVAKAQASVLDIQRVLALGARVLDHDTPLDAQDAAEFKELTKIYESNKGTNLFDQLSVGLQGAWSTRKWTDSLAEFDPTAASHEQLAQHVAGKGAPGVAAMDTDQLKAWALLDMGAPQNVLTAASGFPAYVYQNEMHENGTKAKIEAAAVFQLKVKGAAADGAASAAKAAAVPAPEQTPQGKADLAASKSVYETLSGAKTTYNWPDGTTLSWDAGDSVWVTLSDEGSPNAVEPETAAAMIASGKWLNSSGSSFGDYAAVKADYIEQISGGVAWANLGGHEDGYLDDVAIALDMPASVMADADAYDSWLNGFLLGDSVIQWHALNSSSLEVESKPAEVKVAQQALVDWVSTQPWAAAGDLADAKSAAAYFANPEDLHDAVVALGLDKLDAAKAGHGGGGSTEAKLWQDWVYEHGSFAGYPNPTVTKASPKVTEPQQFGAATAQPGDLVLKSPNGTHMIFPANLGLPGSDEVFLAGSDGTYVTAVPFSTGWPDATNAAEGLAQSMAQNFGNADVTPNWANPIDDGAKAKAASAASQKAPPGIDLEAWQITADPSSESAAALFSVPPTGAAPSTLTAAQEVAGTSALTQSTRVALLNQFDGPTLEMAAWALRAQTYNVPAAQKAFGKKLIDAIYARAQGGHYAVEGQKFTTVGGGGAAAPVTVAVPPGAQVWSNGGGGAGYAGAIIFPAKPGEGWWINGSGNPTGNSYGSTLTESNLSGISGWDKVAESFDNLTVESGHAAGFDFSKAAWDKIAAAETKAPTAGFNPGTAAYVFKMQAVGGDYAPVLAAFPTLPDGVKEYAVKAATMHDYDGLSALAYKASSGYYGAEDAPEVHNPLASHPAYGEPISLGYVSAAAINSWPASAIDAFQDDHNLSHGYSAAHYQAIADKIAEMAPAPAKSPNLKTVSKQSDYGSLTLTKIPGHDKSHYGGQHVKQGWTDQHGEEWMSKSYTDSPSAPRYRVEVENGANVIGRILGFDVGETFVREGLGGDPHAIVTRIHKNADGSVLADLGATYPSDMNDSQLASAMQQHLLDWMLSSHDTHGGNFLLSADGRSVLGIDKSAAFKNHHDDKLAPGFAPSALPEAAWYDRFYNAVAAGTMDRERAATIAHAVLLKAHQVAGRSDGQVADAVAAALAHRTSYNAKFPDAAALSDEVLRRKHALVADFEAMYSALWAKRGWDLSEDVDTAKFSAKVGMAHVSNSAEYAAEVKVSSSSGKALLFATTGLQDSHMMMTSMQQENGGTALIGSAKVTDAALDKKLHEWLQSRVSGNLAYSGGGLKSADPSAQLPLLAEAHKANYDYAQTLASHAPTNGNHPDGQYNTGKIKAAAQKHAVLKTNVEAVLAHRAADPTTPFADGVKFKTLEQQDAWIAAVQKVVADYEMIVAAHDAGTKGTWSSDGKLPIAAPTYTPTPDLGAAGGTAAKWQITEPMIVHNPGGGVTSLAAGDLVHKTTDGGHYVESGGTKTYLSAQAYNEATAFPDGITSLPLPGADGIAGTPTWSATNGWHFAQDGADGKWTLYDSEGLDKGSGYTETTMQDVMGADPDLWTFDDGTEVAEKSATVQAGSKTITVSHRKAGGHGGLLDNKTGKLVENQAKAAQAVAGLSQGYEYTIEHGGVTIRYRPYNETGVTAGQRGQISVEIRDWEGGHGDIDDVLDTLRLAGVDTSAADETSLQLHYWRHLTDEVLADRGDGKNAYGGGGPLPAKYQKILTKVQQDRAANAQMTPEQELASLRAAWASSIGQDKVDDAIWQPQFVGARGGADEGRPTWLRPDYSLAELKKSYGGGKTAALHHIVVGNYDSDIPNDSPFERSLLIAQSGSLLATEERLRVLGKGLTGMSSSTDQGTGGSESIFTRQNIKPSGGGGKQNVNLVFDPLESLRTTNYAQSWDSFGSFEARATSAFAPNTMYGWGGSGNELMIRHGAVPLAGVYATKALRDEAVARLKALEIEKVGEVPIEKWAIVHDDYDKRIAEIWAEAEERLAAIRAGGAE